MYVLFYMTYVIKIGTLAAAHFDEFFLVEIQ